MTNSRVTVILPAYNAAPYILDAVNSILLQTLPDFTLMVIDDGSSDGTFDILKKIADRRILLLKNDRNIGLVKTLNRGLRESKTEYIARMDADDISMPTRLERQIRFLDNNEDYGLCGAWGKSFGESNTKITPPTSDKKIRIEMLFRNCFIHSSVVMRADVLKRHGLDYGQVGAEDYDLWLRLCQVTKVKNLNEELIEYRVHGDQITQFNLAAVEKSTKLLRAKYLNQILNGATGDDVSCLESIAKEEIDQKNMLKCYNLLCKVLHQGSFEFGIGQPDLEAVLQKKIKPIRKVFSRLSKASKVKLLFTSPIFFWGMQSKKLPGKKAWELSNCR